MLDIDEKLTTAGGDIRGGRIIQGPRGAGVSAALPPIGQLPAVGQLPSVPTGSAGGIIVNVFLDSEQIAAKVEIRQRNGLRAAVSGGV